MLDDEKKHESFYTMGKFFLNLTTFTLVSLILVALVILYLYMTKNFKYWQKRKIPCPDGALPALGHTWELISMRKSFGEFCNNIYNNNRQHSMVGVYNFTTPTLMVLEPELVKEVMQTNFNSFHDNTFKIDFALDPLLANNPFFNNGEKWVTARKRLTYAFSSMRLKFLLESVKPVCAQFEKFVDKEIGKNGKAELELKDLFGRFTAQVVAAAGFGVDGLCFDDEKEHESFYTMGKSFLNSTTFSNFIFILVFFVPFVSKVLRIKAVPKKVDNFFRTVITDVMEQRKNQEVSRNDFLQLMKEMEKTEGDKFDLDVIVSHAASFFFDGYETSSITLSFIGFHLANHPDVQKKLREEVTSVLKKYDGVITYDALKDMTYMDQVINESQRLTSAVAAVNKTCTDETELRGSDGLVCRVQRGTPVLIPIQGLQKDPRYWENPELFDPDRFSPERKHSIKKFAFLPFGEGPRICVGMRMALLQMKACLAAVVKQYSLEPSPKTKVPLKMTSATFLAVAEGGLWAYIRPL